MTPKQDGKSWRVPVYNDYGLEEDNQMASLDEDDHMSEIEEWQEEEEYD